jgi:hypothetical protein
MKINGWSVVDSPAGVSVRYDTRDPEICFRVDNSMIIITIYKNYEDNTPVTLTVPLETEGDE